MNLVKEIENYSNMVKSIDEYFRNKYVVENVLRAVREKIILKEGNMDLFGYAEYNFHGIGCRVRWENVTVNFDYSYYENTFEIGLFSPFDIFEFIKSKNEDFELSLDDIVIKLNRLVDENLLLTTNNKFLLRDCNLPLTRYVQK